MALERKMKHALERNIVQILKGKMSKMSTFNLTRISLSKWRICTNNIPWMSILQVIEIGQTSHRLFLDVFHRKAVPDYSTTLIHRTRRAKEVSPSNKYSRVGSSPVDQQNLFQIYSVTTKYVLFDKIWAQIKCRFSLWTFWRSLPANSSFLSVRTICHLTRLQE